MNMGQRISWDVLCGLKDASEIMLRVCLLADEEPGET